MTVRRLARLVAVATIALLIGSGCPGRPKSAVELPRSRYCAPERRAAWAVVEQACRDVSELTREGATETEVTSAVRHWVAGWTDVYSDRILAGPEDYWKIGLDSQLAALNRDDYGLACGNTAWILMQVYEVLGLESYVYNFGDDSGSGISHVLTLVRADDRIIVQDAYTNFTLTNASGEPLDVHDALRMLRFGPSDQVLIRTQPTTKQVLLSVDDGGSLDEIAASARGAFAPHGLDPAECRLIRYTAARCIAHNVDASNIEYWHLWPALKAFVQKRGLEPTLLSLMLFPLGVSSSHDGWTPVDDDRETLTNRLVTSMLYALRNPPKKTGKPTPPMDVESRSGSSSHHSEFP